jgi:ribosome-associated toxin RatA of RatAB toxin-antitoxin module
MRAENSIVMYAPLEKIFEIAADLSLWPKILPHYRWVWYIEKSPTKNVVQMAAMRGWIPIQWTSVQEIDRERMQVRFRHFKAFTKGMEVVWTFTATHDGVEVRIRHDLKPTIPIIGTFIAEKIIGKFFVSHVANRTLTHMKAYLEKKYGA